MTPMVNLQLSGIEDRHLDKFAVAVVDGGCAAHLLLRMPLQNVKILNDENRFIRRPGGNILTKNLTFSL
jgi:hypothetical protein